MVFQPGHFDRARAMMESSSATPASHAKKDVATSADAAKASAEAAKALEEQRVVVVVLCFKILLN